MRDLEKEMAKALEGCFFWEQTARNEGTGCPQVAEIRSAQRKFYKPKPKEAERKEIVKKIREAEEIKRSYAELAVDSNPVSISRKISKHIATIHGVSEYDISSTTTNPKVGLAKAHLCWSIHRYSPGTSLSKMARQIGRHHTSVMHRIRKFEKVKAEYTEEIALIDRIMGFGT